MAKTADWQAGGRILRELKQAHDGSRPFLKPNGKCKAADKIAIKATNHYGDGVLKVYSME